MSSCLDQLNFVEGETLKPIILEENSNKYFSFGNWILTNLVKQDLSSIFIGLTIVILSWIVINWIVRLIFAIVWPIAFVTVFVVCIYIKSIMFKSNFFFLQYILPCLLNGSMFSSFINPEIGCKEMLLKLESVFKYTITLGVSLCKSFCKYINSK